MGEVDQQSLHLSDAQIEQYGSASNSAKTETGGLVEAHLADCSTCRNRLLVSQRDRFALMGGIPMKTALSLGRRGPNCPSEDDLRNLAAGLCPPGQASQFTEHAAQCDHCGSLLRMYTEDFSEELNKEDKAVLEKLNSSSPEWQKDLVSQIFVGSSASPARPAKRSLFWKWILVPATATVCAAAAFAIWYWQRETPEKVEKLLAQSYTEQRTMEMRFPGAAWAPMHVTRGSEASSFSKPAPRIDAEGIIRHKQATDPNNAEWLRVKAEADILDRNPEPAIVGLNQALRSRPASVPLMLDLSIAYALQGEISQDSHSYLTATNLLGQVLEREPNNSTALFDRALAYERFGNSKAAIADWEELLVIEKDPAWNDEIRKKLDQLRR